MTARKLEKLEQKLCRTIKDIRETTSPVKMMTYIRRFGALDHQYTKLTGTRFNPALYNDQLQDVEWGHRERYPAAD